MNDDWRPSDYKPRGGWRAMLPGWGVLLAALGGAGFIAIKMIALDGWDRDASFNLMKIGAAILAGACVAPHVFSGKAPPRPGQFPTERGDQRVARNDQETP